jgi:hypothetical protein
MAFERTPPFERTPSRRERFWARRFVLIGVVLAVIGVVVGGSASAYFLIAAMVCGLAAAFCRRGTIDVPGGGDGGGGGGGF